MAPCASPRLSSGGLTPACSSPEGKSFPLPEDLPSPTSVREVLSTRSRRLFFFLSAAIRASKGVFLISFGLLSFFLIHAPLSAAAVLNSGRLEYGPRGGLSPACRRRRFDPHINLGGTCFEGFFLLFGGCVLKKAEELLSSSRRAYVFPAEPLLFFAA